MEKVRILIACHKPVEVPSDGIYMPIHVGKALHSEIDLGFIGDDTGDNISVKNLNYCELTAQYWAWKNLSVDFIGLCHYRRFFNMVITSTNIELIMKNFDVMLPKPIVWHCRLFDKLYEDLTFEDATIFFKVIMKLYPDYEEDLINYLYDCKFVPYNMIVCRKELFNKFAEWQFSILFECEKYIKLSGYSRLRRIYGYFSEYLLPLYFIHNSYKIKYCTVTDSVGGNVLQATSFKKLLRYYLIKIFPTMKRPHKISDVYIESKLLGSPLFGLFCPHSR